MKAAQMQVADWLKIDPMDMVVDAVNPEDRDGKPYHTWVCRCGGRGTWAHSSIGRARRQAASHLATHTRPRPPGASAPANKPVKAAPRMHQNTRAMLWAKQALLNYAITYRYGGATLTDALEHEVYDCLARRGIKDNRSAVDVQLKFADALDEVLRDPGQNLHDVDLLCNKWQLPIFLHLQAVHRAVYDMFLANSAIMPDPTTISTTSTKPSQKVDYIIKGGNGHVFRLPQDATFRDLCHALMPLVDDDDPSHGYCFEIQGKVKSAARRLPDDPSRTIADHRQGTDGMDEVPRLRADKVHLWQVLPNDNNPFHSTNFGFWWDFGSPEYHALEAQAVPHEPTANRGPKKGRQVVDVGEVLDQLFA